MAPKSCEFLSQSWGCLIQGVVLNRWSRQENQKLVNFGFGKACFYFLWNNRWYIEQVDSFFVVVHWSERVWANDVWSSILFLGAGNEYFFASRTPGFDLSMLEGDWSLVHCEKFTTIVQWNDLHNFLANQRDLWPWRGSSTPLEEAKTNLGVLFSFCFDMRARVWSTTMLCVHVGCFCGLLTPANTVRCGTVLGCSVYSTLFLRDLCLQCRIFQWLGCCTLHFHFRGKREKMFCKSVWKCVWTSTRLHITYISWTNNVSVETRVSILDRWSKPTTDFTND